MGSSFSQALENVQVLQMAIVNHLVHNVKCRGLFARQNNPQSIFHTIYFTPHWSLGVKILSCWLGPVGVTVQGDSISKLSFTVFKDESLKHGTQTSLSLTLNTDISTAYLARTLPAEVTFWFHEQQGTHARRIKDEKGDQGWIQGFSWRIAFSVDDKNEDFFAFIIRISSVVFIQE